MDWAKLLAKALNRDKIIVRGFSWERPHYCPILQARTWKSTDPIIIHSFNPFNMVCPILPQQVSKPSQAICFGNTLFWGCYLAWSTSRIIWYVGFLHFVHGDGPQWTSTHQHIIHWMPVITRLWMNLNWVSIWFHFGNPLCTKF